MLQPGLSGPFTFGPPSPSEETCTPADDPSSRLYTEMLAECFGFLSFRDLISASHVSCSWRSAALAFPALWSQIRISWSIRDAGDLLHMAMSRAGGLPVDFEYRSFYHPPSQNFISAVSQYMNRFRSMAWDAPRHLDLTMRAPLLETLVLGSHIYMLPKAFLGRAAGSLRRLHIADTRFPKVCPALTTLTDLRASCPWYVSGDLGVHRIFALCPRLDILHLRCVHDRPEGALPAGPPPPTLREVTLHARADCDLVRLYHASSLTSVPRVRLEQPLATAYSMAPFLDGALDLSMVFDADSSQARIVASMPGTREPTLFLYELEWASRPAIFIAKILREMQTATVRMLRVPLSMLSHLLTEAPHCDWPRVSRLTVDIFESDTPVDARSNFRWPSLDCLRELSHRFPALTALLLSVHLQDAEIPPQLADARALVQRLSGLGELPGVYIQGFPDDIARAMSVDPASPPQIVFDV